MNTERIWRGQFCLCFRHQEHIGPSAAERRAPIEDSVLPPPAHRWELRPTRKGPDPPAAVQKGKDAFSGLLSPSCQPFPIMAAFQHGLLVMEEEAFETALKDGGVSICGDKDESVGTRWQEDMG